MNHAQEIDNLRSELERVKGIAGRRLVKINALQLELAQIEDDPRRLEDSDDDELEDIRSDLKYEKGISTQQRSLAGKLAGELADAQARIADLEKLADNRLERIMHLLSAIDAKDFDTIQRDNELAAEVDPEQTRELAHERGRETNSRLEDHEDHGGLWGAYCRGELT